MTTSHKCLPAAEVETTAKLNTRQIIDCMTFRVCQTVRTSRRNSTMKVLIPTFECHKLSFTKMGLIFGDILN